LITVRQIRLSAAFTLAWSLVPAIVQRLASWIFSAGVIAVLVRLATSCLQTATSAERFCDGDAGSGAVAEVWVAVVEAAVLVALAVLVVVALELTLVVAVGVPVIGALVGLLEPAAGPA
jgi:hypothetical protein